MNPQLESLPRDVLSYIVLFLQPPFEARFVLRFLKCFHRLPAVLEFKKNNCGKNGILLCKYAAEQGSISVLQWLRSRLHCPWDESVPAAAAFGGHLDCLIWLYNNNCFWGDSAVIQATEGNQKAVLEWLRKISQQLWGKNNGAIRSQKGRGGKNPKRYQKPRSSPFTFHLESIVKKPGQEYGRVLKELGNRRVGKKKNVIMYSEKRDPSRCALPRQSNTTVSSSRKHDSTDVG